MAAGTPAARRPGPPRRFDREAATFYLFAAPWIVGFLAFTLGPMLAAAYLSLTEYGMVAEPRWVGLRNYQRMLFSDRLFWQSLQVTLTYALLYVPLLLALALAIALLLNRRVRGIAAFRTIYFLPTVLPAIASVILWWYLLNKDYGLVNAALGLVGVEGPAWLHTSETALWAVILIGLWGFGYTMVIFLAGLQGVPAELYEAAEIDGAGRLARFRHVTLPMISPVMFFNLTVGTIGALQVFTPAFVLGSVISGIGLSGPGNSLLFYALYLYNSAFRFLQMGYAAALAWFLFVVILLITAVHFLVGRRWVYYGGGR
jgi:multiple sugar transport system permease protein